MFRMKVDGAMAAGFARNFRHRLARAGQAAAIAGLLVALTSCSIDARQADASLQDRLYTKAFDEITDLYIDPITAEPLALAGLQHLDTIDPAFSVSDAGGVLQVFSNGGIVGTIRLPDERDNRAWARLTTGVIRIARASSPKIAAATEDAINTAVFDGAMAKLDGFSRYAPPQSARFLRDDRDGFGGIGVTLDYSNKRVRIASVLAKGPAEQGGIKSEDEITAVDGAPLAGLTNIQVVEKLRGQVDSLVRLTLARTGVQPFDVSLRRRLIVTPTVTSRIDDGLLYLKISTFNYQTSENVEQAVGRARAALGPGLRGIILDLRGDPGGLLDQGVAVAGSFLNGGVVITTRGRNRASAQRYTASEDITGGLPIVLLVNGGSASAAEIVAAALQDTGRAVVVGTSSYGKGTVQTALRLPNSGELTVTWARIYSPSGYVLHKHGVVPSICTSDMPDENAAINAAIDRGTHPQAGMLLAQRTALDEAGWNALRMGCKPASGERDVDVAVAKRLLDNGVLYAAALRESPADPQARNLASTPVFLQR